MIDNKTVEELLRKVNLDTGKGELIAKTEKGTALMLREIWKPPDGEEFNRNLSITVFGDEERGIPMPEETAGIMLSSMAKCKKAEDIAPNELLNEDNAPDAAILKKEIDSFIVKITERFDPGKEFLRLACEHARKIIKILTGDLEVASARLEAKLKEYKTRKEKEAILEAKKAQAEAAKAREILKQRAEKLIEKKPEKARELISQAESIIPNAKPIKTTGWVYKLTITDKRKFFMTYADKEGMINWNNVRIMESELNRIAEVLSQGIGEDLNFPWGYITATQR